MIDGSGAGVVAAAAAGLLADNPTIFYAGTLDAGAKLLHEAVSPGAQLVLTDSNRKELERWSSVQDNIGETLPAVAEPTTPDPTAVSLPIFAHLSPDAQSVALFGQARYVTASTYGNPVAFTPEDRRRRGLRRQPSTAWSVAAFSKATGNWLQIRLDHAVTTDQLNLVQVLGSSVNRWITRVTLQLRRRPFVPENARPAASRSAGGQTVRFPRRSFTTLRITIDARRASAAGCSRAPRESVSPRSAFPAYKSPRRSSCLRICCARLGARRSPTASRWC